MKRHNIWAIAALLLCVSCKEGNIVAVDLCTDSKEGSLATLRLKNKNGFADNYICRFPVGSTCAELQKAKRVEIVEKQLLHSRCKYTSW